MSTDNPIHAFEREVARNIHNLGADPALRDLSLQWIKESARHKWTYNFTWLGRPIIQFPNDMVAMQEIIWRVRPDLIVETGIAHGGSLVFSASMLALLDLCEGRTGNPRTVLGVDIEIRPHNRAAIEAHPLADRITMIQGSSIAEETVDNVREVAEGKGSVLVCLDSNHTAAHVLSELRAYAPLVTKGSYCVVFDTIISDMPADMFPDRPWGPENNPRTAVNAFLHENPNFHVDHDLDHKLQISVAPHGYLRRIA